MTEPIRLPRPVVLATQEALLQRFGGLGGIRDEGMLDSALHRPEHLYRYGKPSLYELAAAYASGMVQNHPFIDGNKRIGFMAAYIFLRANGKNFQATEEEVVAQTRTLAAGAITEDAYAKWLGQSCA